MNKLKLIIVSIAVLILAIVCVFLFRFVKDALFAATGALIQAGEEPIEEHVEETQDTWAPPEMSDTYDLNAGIDSVVPEVDEPSVDVDDDSDEDLVEVPVEQTVDQLAGTGPDDDIDDGEGPLPD